MRPQRTKNLLALTTATAAAALLLSGCGAGAAQNGSSSQATTPAASPPGPPAASGTVGPTPDSAGPTPDSSSPPQPDAGSGPALCKAAGLVASIEISGAAAGSVYQEVVLTNSGAGPCLLKGFPGVSLTADATGEPIGAPAVRDASSPITGIVLAPGQAGTATLRYTQAGNYPHCKLVEASGFRIYPPEDTASLFAPDTRNACSNTDINLLTIRAFQAR